MKGTMHTAAGPARKNPGGEYEDLGCEVNALSPVELFRRLAATPFLTPEKQQRLEPYMPQIVDNWQRAMRAGELLHCVVTHEAPDGGWASLGRWRSTHAGWHTQHLAATGAPGGAVRAVMLATQAAVLRDGSVGSCQSWFRPGGPLFAQAAFEGLPSVIDSAASSVLPSDCVMVPLRLCRALADTRAMPDPRVEELDGGKCPELAELAQRCRGAAYTEAEALEGDDLLLTEIDRLYGLVGLRRYRRIWIRRDGCQHPQAAAVAYRGPLGFNFSFLENRCDLLVDPALDAPAAQRAVHSLLASAYRTYEDFGPGAVPVVLTTGLGSPLQPWGAERIDAYTQAIWLAEDVAAWYRHLVALHRRRPKWRRQNRGRGRGWEGAPA